MKSEREQIEFLKGEILGEAQAIVDVQARHAKEIAKMREALRRLEAELIELGGQGADDGDEK